MWLGPPGRRWPFDATYVTWATGLALCVVLCPVWFGIGWAIGGASLGWPFAVMVAPFTAVLATRYVTKVVDYHRPLRYWRAEFRSLFSDPRTVNGPLTYRLRARTRRFTLPRHPAAMLPPRPAGAEPPLPSSLGTALDRSA